MPLVFPVSLVTLIRALALCVYAYQRVIDCRALQMLDDPAEEFEAVPGPKQSWDNRQPAGT